MDSTADSYSEQFAFCFFFLSTLKNALAAASCLKQALRESPAVAEILRVGVQAGISEEQALMDMLFMLKLVIEYFSR